MKKTLLLLPILLLLVSCTSKRDTCALVDSGQISKEEAMMRLELKDSGSGPGWVLSYFCSYYGN